MKNYTFSPKDAKQLRRNEYKEMVADGLSISNWSATHIPYSNKTTAEVLEEKKELEEILLKNVLDIGGKVD